MILLRVALRSMRPSSVTKHNHASVFFSQDGRVFPDIIDGVRTNVWYELNRRGIRLAFSTQQIELVPHRAPDTDARNGFEIARESAAKRDDSGDP